MTEEYTGRGYIGRKYRVIRALDFATEDPDMNESVTMYPGVELIITSEKERTVQTYGPSFKSLGKSILELGYIRTDDNATGLLLILPAFEEILDKYLIPVNSL